MSDDKLPLSFSRETLEEVKSLLRGADPDAPLVDRLRNPRTPYRPALLREEAADRIEELEAKLKTYDEIGWALEEDAGQLRAKLAKAVGLVQQAFNEGFGSGMDDVLKSSGGRTWYDSRSRKRLAEINGGGDE